jgi:hypothetical protein
MKHPAPPLSVAGDATAGSTPAANRARRAAPRRRFRGEASVAAKSQPALAMDEREQHDERISARLLTSELQQSVSARAALS